MLLQETIIRASTTSLADLSTTHSYRRRKKLASFMGTLLEEMTRAETTKAPSVTTGNTSVLGNISPHDETGSESPPSYNQLNYNDNLTRFFNSQPKTLTEKEASAIESSSVFYDDKFKFQNCGGGDSGSGSGSRNIRSASPPFDTSNTTSENISNNLKHKSAYAPHAADQGSGGGDSGENGGTGSGHGTSGGVSAAGANHHKRIHAHTYGRHSAGSGNNSGISVADSNSGNYNPDKYKPPLLTEQLLSAHNRGMEKKMIDSYKEGKKGDLKFLKNRLRSAKAAYQQAMKRSHHQSWNMAHHRVLHKELHGGRHGGPGGGAGPSTLIHDPHIDPIQLWPPFSVANSGLPVQVKPASSMAGAGNPQSG